MSIAQAILLGLIQGLSEFLPISSTAHLTLAGRAMNLIDSSRPESWTAFIAVIQIGTLVAVLAYFARDIAAITRAFVQATRARTPFREQSLEARSAILIVLGTIPIVVVGLLFKDQIEGMFTKNLIVIGTSLVVLALLLELAERIARFDRPIEAVRIRDALLIGAAQAVALIPGSSRSGTTITAGLFAGLTREAAARFSFLLSIPAVAASGALELLHALEFFDRSELLALVIATLVSAVSGYAAIWFLLRYLRSHTTRLFIVYRLLIGGAILAAVALDWLQP